MSQLEIQNNIIGLMKEVGISIDKQIDLEKEDVDLTEYFVDSFVFISFVVELENSFDIVIPEEFASMDQFSSLKALSIVIEDLLDN